MQIADREKIWQFFTKKWQKFWLPNSDNSGKNVHLEY